MQSRDEVGSKYKDVLIDSGSAVFHQQQQLHKTIVYIYSYMVLQRPAIYASETSV